MNSSATPKPMIMVAPLRPAPATAPDRCVACPRPRRAGSIYCLIDQLKAIRSLLQIDDRARAEQDLNDLIGDLERKTQP